MAFISGCTLRGRGAILCGESSGAPLVIPTSRSSVRFGAFEADFHAGELRKSGIRIKIQQQPMRVLAALVERPGELVTREELQRRLWPDVSYLDFEHGLNAAVKKLRVALNDSADS